ncbi:MAG: replication protein [Circular genetic element sp.]|nr:MAG: replication protein [Circular genetic element sp.]
MNRSRMSGFMPLSSDCIQDKEKPLYGFFCKDCEIYDNLLGTVDKPNGWENRDYIRQHCRPNRCTKCDRELKRWQREMNGIEQIKKQFNWERHKFLKFGTIGLAGSKEFPIDMAEDQIKPYREELVAKFKILRRKPIWKDCVDGGKWFFEVTTRTHVTQKQLDDGEYTVSVKLNPHLHILFMGPKKINYDQLQLACKKVGLGKFHFSKSTSGTKFQNVLRYISGYLKKDNQFQGVNRGSFGFLQGNKK